MDGKTKLAINFQNKSIFNISSIFSLGFILALFLFFSLACSSHLQEAKLYFSQGQEHLQRYQTSESRISFQKAKEAAQAGIKKQSLAQLYVIKGLAEVQLEEWPEAEKSFSLAYSLGFEKGEEWAAEAALYGLAQSLEEFGLTTLALESYSHLLSRSKFKPVTILAAGRYVQIKLAQILSLPPQEKSKNLELLLEQIRKLLKQDYHLGYYHYLSSQILSHRGRYQESFEEGVMARELGLPSSEIFRDNDRQLIFCYRQLKKELPPSEWNNFSVLYHRLTNQWGWGDEETPSWMKR